MATLKKKNICRIKKMIKQWFVIWLLPFQKLNIQQHIIGKR